MEFVGWGAGCDRLVASWGENENGYRTPALMYKAFMGWMAARTKPVHQGLADN